LLLRPDSIILKFLQANARVKGKVVPLLKLIKRHAVKACGGVEV
jgi:hypothetical protein